MNDWIVWITQQPNEIYTAVAVAVALFLFVDMFRSARFQKVTLLGRVLGYAPRQHPKQETQGDHAIKQLEQRLVHLHENQDRFISARIEEIGDVIEKIQRDVDWLTTDQIISVAVAMAKNGGSNDQVSTIKGLTEEEAELIRKYVRH